MQRFMPHGPCFGRRPASWVPSTGCAESLPLGPCATPRQRLWHAASIDVYIVATFAAELRSHPASGACSRLARELNDLSWLQCPIGHRLPALYLLDSISKSVGEPFRGQFAPLLPELFGLVWRVSTPCPTPPQVLALP